MENEIFETASVEVREREVQVENVKSDSKNDEQIAVVANTAEVAKNKEETKSEKELREAKEELKKTKDKIAELKKTALNDRTEEQKEQFKALSKALQENKYRLAKARQEYDRFKNSRLVRQQKKKLEEGKQQAIIKILEAEGIGTENEVKKLISIKRILKNYGVNDVAHLKNILDYVVRNTK